LLVRAIILVPLISFAVANAASLESGTSSAWEEYIQSATARMQQRLAPNTAFLWTDESPDRLARVKAGEIVVAPVGAQSPKKVPSGLIHDWIGTVFVPHARMSDALQIVRDYSKYKDLYQPGVIDSKTISTGEDRDLYSMQLMNRALLLKTAFTADYEACYVQVDERRVYSIARSDRIQEIENYGAPAQRVLPEGQGHGIIWRLFAVTRYLERDGGIYIEFEAIVLSRDIPVSIRWMVEPVVRRVSRSSLATSLEQTERAVRARTEVAKSSSALGFKP
jgi:hypothetical protein